VHRRGEDEIEIEAAEKKEKGGSTIRPEGRKRYLYSGQDPAARGERIRSCVKKRGGGACQEGRKRELLRHQRGGTPRAGPAFRKRDRCSKV